MTYFPSDYITRWEANRGLGMVAPWLHHDWRVRALHYKRRNAYFEAIVTDCAKPSAEYDEAFDAMIDADEKYENVIRTAAFHRLAANANHFPSIPEQHSNRNEKVLA